jgi:hypothetical protein
MQTLLLQSGQINWFAILGPSLISGFFVIAVQILLATRLSKLTEGHKAALSKEVEDYKKGISKELEIHRSKLEAEFQTGFYQFQTNYSLLHEKRAEAIEKLFALLATVQNNLTILTAWEGLSRGGNKAEFYSKTLEDFYSLIEFHRQKRIYFDGEVVAQVKTLEKTIGTLLSSHDSREWLSSSAPGFGPMKAAAMDIILKNIHPLMNGLEEKFKSLLSAEAPTHQPAKNQ